MPSNDTVTVELLRELPIARGLSDAQLSRVAGLARLEHVPGGGQLLREGGPATDLRIVVDGKLSLSLDLGGDGVRCLLTIAAGEIIGWSAMLDGPTWLASATALRASKVVLFDGAALRRLCETDHDIGYHIMRNLFTEVAARLHDTRMQLLDLYGHD